MFIDDGPLPKRKRKIQMDNAFVVVSYSILCNYLFLLNISQLTNTSVILNVDEFTSFLFFLVSNNPVTRNNDLTQFVSLFEVLLIYSHLI